MSLVSSLPLFSFLHQNCILYGGKEEAVAVAKVGGGESSRLLPPLQVVAFLGVEKDGERASHFEYGILDLMYCSSNTHTFFPFVGGAIYAP